MNVLYLTWGEIVAYDGIFDNQVVENLKLIKRQSSDINLSLVSGMPIINRYFLLQNTGFNREISRIELILNQDGIKFTTRWIFAIARWFRSQPAQLMFYSLFQESFLKNYVLQSNVQIIHCRGYHATRLALLTRDKYKLNFKVIFDVRGLFPEEGILVGRFTEQSRGFKQWKAIEKFLLNNSDVIVALSETFSTYLQSLTQNRQIYTVYPGTNTDNFFLDPAQKPIVRTKLDLPSGSKVLVYLGSIHPTRSWHTTTNLAAVFKAFQATFENAFLLVITRSSPEMLKEAFETDGLDLKKVIFVKASSPAETNLYLQAGDYATLPFRQIQEKIESLIGYTMNASKTGEYLATGLPLIVNKDIGSASQLVQKYNLGCAYETGQEMYLMKLLRNLDSEYDVISKRCRFFAKDLYSGKKVAQKYMDLYRKLVFS